MSEPCVYSNTCGWRDRSRLHNDCRLVTCEAYRPDPHPKKPETVELNLDVKNECHFCHGEFNPLFTTSLLLKGHIYTLCFDCAEKVEKILKGEEQWI